MSDGKEIPPEAGKRPPFKNSEPPLGDVGGEGYFGESYDSDSEKAWRERAKERDTPAEASGSGMGAGGGQAGEDYDDEAGGSDATTTPGGMPPKKPGVTP